MPGCDVGTVSCTPYFSEICSLTTPVTAYTKSLHTRFIHLMSWTHCYYTLPCAASVPMLCGSI